MYAWMSHNYYNKLHHHRICWYKILELQKNIVSYVDNFVYLMPEAVVRRCSVENVFLEISQNLQENTSARVSFLIKLQGSGLQKETIEKKTLAQCKISKDTFFL